MTSIQPGLVPWNIVVPEWAGSGAEV